MENQADMAEISTDAPETCAVEGEGDARQGKTGGRKRKLKSIFSKEFVIDSLFLEKRDIKNYIAGRVIPILGDDYYYGYTYKNGLLSFIAQKSTSLDIGQLSAFTPAFMEPGEYVYKDGMKYYVITHGEDGFIKSIVHYEIPTDALDISGFTMDDMVEDIPKTLHFQWSLARNNRPMNLVLLVVFVLAFIAFGVSAQSYNGLARQTAMLDDQPNTVHGSVGARLPDISQVVKECVRRIGGKGTIRQIRAENDAIVFTIQFPAEGDARDFIEKNGGKYESNQVVLALVTSNNSQPVSGK